MGLQDDWDELKKMWGKCSLASKIFLAVSFFLSCTSIASLADSIFQFRGFLLTTIEFYRVLIEHLVEVANNWLQIYIPVQVFDIFIFFTLVTISVSKAEKIVLGEDPLFAYLFAAVLLISVFFLILTLIGDIGAFVGTVPFVLFLIPVWLLYDLIKSLIKSWRQKDEYTLLKAKYARLSFAYILTILLIVAVIASISEGLTRPL